MLLEGIVLAISLSVGFCGRESVGADQAWEQTTGWLIFSVLGCWLLLFQAGWPILLKLRKWARSKPCRRRQSIRKRCQVAIHSAEPLTSRRIPSRCLKSKLHPVFGGKRPWWVETWLLKVALWLGTIISPASRHPKSASRRAPAWRRPVVTPDGPGLRGRDRCLLTA